MLECIIFAKYLEATIKSGLNWDELVTDIVTRANKILGILRRNLKIKLTNVKE